jgi:hypothetical protein
LKNSSRQRDVRCPPFVMEPTDQFAEFQQRHFHFFGLAVLSPATGPHADMLTRKVRGAKGSGFPQAVTDLLQQLFEYE